MARIPTSARLRYTWWARVFILAAATLFIWGTVSELSAGSLLTRLAWGILSVMGVVGVAETLVGRIELHPDCLVIIGPLERRVYPREAIVGLKRVWKVGLFLQLRNDKSVKLESIGLMGPKAIPTVRNWLRQTRMSA